MKILVCIDGSDSSKKCVEVAAGIACNRSDCDVTLLYVHENAPFFPDYWHGSYPFTAEEEKQLKKIDKRIIEERKKFFASSEKVFAEQGIPVSSLFKVGRPADVIIRIAEEGGYDLIVIGRRGQGGVKKIFLGSVSNAVLQGAKTNVLVVR